MPVYLNVYWTLSETNDVQIHRKDKARYKRSLLSADVRHVYFERKPGAIQYQATPLLARLSICTLGLVSLSLLSVSVSVSVSMSVSVSAAVSVCVLNPSAQ